MQSSERTPPAGGQKSIDPKLWALVNLCAKTERRQPEVWFYNVGPAPGEGRSREARLESSGDGTLLGARADEHQGGRWRRWCERL